MLEKDLESMISKSLESAKDSLEDADEDDIDALLKSIEENIDKQKGDKTLDMINKLIKQLEDEKVEAALATAMKLKDILKKYPYPAEKVKKDKPKELTDEEKAEEFVSMVTEIQKKGAKLSAIVKSKISAAIKALQEVLGEKVEKKENEIEFTKEEKDKIAEMAFDMENELA